MSLKGESNLNRTFRAGHEEYIEHVCDSCLIDNRRVEAEGHCKDCKQNICNECINSHKKLAGLRRHVIEKEPKTSANISKGKELTKLKTDLQNLEESLTVHKISTEKIQSDIIDSYANTVDQIKQWRMQVDKTLDKLENDMIENASALKKEALSSLAENSLACKRLLLETQQLLKDFEGNMKLDHNKQMISVKQTQETLSKIRAETERVGEQCRPHTLSFYPHENILTTLSTLNLGNVYISGEPASIRAKYVRDTYVKSSTDSQDCFITSILFLPDGRICVGDFDNKSIKLVDPLLIRTTEQINFSIGPLGSSMINKDEIAVLISDDKNLQVLSISPSLSTIRSIQLPNKYSAMSYCQHKLLMTKWSKNDGYGWIDICDITGNLMKRIETNVDGSKILTYPRRICLNPDHSMMYITDDERHSVVCVNMDGDVINIFQHEKLKKPMGITVDQDGNVYICSCNNHMIHQLTPTGELVQIILDKKDGLKGPYAIAYRSGQLYISSNCTSPALQNNIKVFSLT